MKEILKKESDATSFKICLHVTSADAVASIMSDGLVSQVGPLSAQLNEQAGVYMFPSWEDMENANWLFDEWPYDSEPALLCVKTDGMELVSEAGFEVASRAGIPADRIVLLAPGEDEWDLAKKRFEELGGRIKSCGFEDTSADCQDNTLEPDILKADRMMDRTAKSLRPR